MSYYKSEIRYDDMNLEQLQEAKRKHFENPKYFLKLVKPPFYYTWMRLLDAKIERLINKKPE